MGKGGRPAITENEYVSKIHKYNENIVITEPYINSYTKINHKCLICGYEKSIKPCGLRDRGYNFCPNCQINKNYHVEIGTNDLHTTHPELCYYLYNKNDQFKYSFGSAIKVDWICDKCSTITHKCINLVTQVGMFKCPICSDGLSLPNKVMYSLLTQLKIPFKSEYCPKWCVFDYHNRKRRGKYDFHFKLDNNDYIIEMDGDWHKRDNQFSGQTKEESNYIDLQKDKLAKENDCKMIRIDCYGCTFDIVMNAIINSCLFEILNLSIVDWNKIRLITARSIIWNICKDFSTNETSVQYLKEKYNLSTTTVKKYLREGVKLGFCNYDSQIHKQVNNNAVSVRCITNGKEYPSLSAAARDLGYSAHGTLCGVGCKISEVCSGKREYWGKDKITKDKLHWEFC